MTDGFVGTLKQVAEHCGISVSTLGNRIHHGMSIQEAIQKPARKHGKLVKYTLPDGFTGSIRAIAKHTGICDGTLKARLYRGMSMDEAVSLPVRSFNQRYALSDGFVGTVKEIAKRVNINESLLYARLHQGMCINGAIEASKKCYTLYDGFVGNLVQVAKHVKIPQERLYHAMEKGMTIDECIFEAESEVRFDRKYALSDGFVGNLGQVAKHVGIPRTTLLYRLKNGMNIGEVVTRH